MKMLTPKLSRRRQHRKNCLLAFLEKCLNDRSKQELIRWINEPKGLFQILWVHGGRSNYQRRTHGCLFDLYREYRGRSLTSDPKQTFRMALKKSPCIEAAEGASSEDWRPFRIIHKCHDEDTAMDTGNDNITTSFTQPPVDGLAVLGHFNQVPKSNLNITNSEKTKPLSFNDLRNKRFINSHYSFSVIMEDNTSLKNRTSTFSAEMSNTFCNELEFELPQFCNSQPSCNAYNCKYMRPLNSPHSDDSGQSQIKVENTDSYIFPMNSQQNSNLLQPVNTPLGPNNSKGYVYDTKRFANDSRLEGYEKGIPNNIMVTNCTECILSDFNSNFPSDNDGIWKAIENLLSMTGANEL